MLGTCRRLRLRQFRDNGGFSGKAPALCESISMTTRRHSTKPVTPNINPNAKQVIFSGIQPTGVPHLGNYLGALQQWVRLQNSAASSTKLLYSVVDLHAITIQQDPKQLRQWRREVLATLLAIGLNPDRSILFYQSSVSRLESFSMLTYLQIAGSSSCRIDVDSELHCFDGISFPHDPVEGVISISILGNTRLTLLQSKLSLKDDASPLDGGSKSKLKLGLFSYPVLQAADIMVHR